MEEAFLSGKRLDAKAITVLFYGIKTRNQTRLRAVLKNE